MPYVFPNNIVLLVRVEHFDPDLIVVNVGKLKPYGVAEELLLIDLLESTLSKLDVKNMVQRNENKFPDT